MSAVTYKTPKHYNSKIQPVDVWDCYELDPYRANFVKYIERHLKKGTPKEDIHKAIHYIEMFVDRNIHICHTPKMAPRVEKEFYLEAIEEWGITNPLLIGAFGFVIIGLTNGNKATREATLYSIKSLLNKYLETLEEK
jgi:hypothetical protein